MNCSPSATIYVMNCGRMQMKRAHLTRKNDKRSPKLVDGEDAARNCIFAQFLRGCHVIWLRSATPHDSSRTMCTIMYH
jgi:hypothetical protein